LTLLNNKGKQDKTLERPIDPGDEFFTVATPTVLDVIPQHSPLERVWGGQQSTL
jgi:hypothetical protein